MTWDSGNNRWKIPGTTYGYIANGSIHPENGEPMLAWVAPSAGTITITGNVRRIGGGGDGVGVKIQKNSDSPIWSMNVLQGNGGWNDTGTNTITVSAGDRIYFCVNQLTNNGYDNTEWNPQIVFNPS
jgi:hypothetical protein